MSQTHGSTSRTAFVRARDWESFQGMSRREQDAFLAEQWFADTAEPFDPGDDFEPTAIDLDQNLGMTVVEVCGYVGYGDASEEMCWDVEAATNSPQWSAVA